MRQAGAIRDAAATAPAPAIANAYDDTDDAGGGAHDFVSNLRRVDGSIPVHPQYGPPVNIFSPKGTRKYWVGASTPVLG